MIAEQGCRARQTFWITATCFLGSLLAGLGPGPHHCRAEQPSRDSLRDWTAELVRTKQLAVEFYDPQKPPKPLPGWTDFEFDLKYRFECEIIPRSGTSPAVVQVRFHDVNVSLRHRILIPDALNDDNWLNAALGRHELDHVRVGMHPRVVLLGQALINSVQRIPIPDTMPTPKFEWIEQQITSRLQARRDALQQQIQSTNRDLDVLTNRGALALPDDGQFLETVFSHEQLHERKFPYLAEVLDVVKSKQYREARLEFRPPQRPARP